MAPVRSLQYRLASIDDVAGMQAVVDECWEADYPAVISRERIRNGLLEWYDDDHLAREIRSADAVVAVAVAERKSEAGEGGSSDDDGGGSIRGFTHAVLDGAEGTILRLYVVPDDRRAGVGTELLEYTIDELAERGVDRIVALALARNDVAAEFYRATGFEQIRTETTTIAGDRYDELVFERPV